MSQDKNKLDNRVRGYVEYQLEHYRQHKRKLAEYRAAMMPSSTPSYGSRSGGAKGESRPTEALGVKLASDEFILEQLRTIDAIERVLARLGRDDRRLVELVYWRRSHTITGAGMVVNMSKTTAYRHVEAVIDAIACELGLASFTPTSDVGKKREKSP